VRTLIDLLLQEFNLIRDRVRWIQVGQGDEAAENDCKSHGTAMLSLVVGRTVGVAKNIDPVIVRMPCRIEPNPQPNNPDQTKKGVMKPAEWIAALGMINDDYDGTGPAVVLMAEYWQRLHFRDEYGDPNWDGFAIRHKALLTSLASKGAVLITGTGNGGDSTIDGWPANHGKADSEWYVPSLIVVGGEWSDASNPFGNTHFSEGLPHIYAPAAPSIRVADSDESTWEYFPLRDTRGTSCSAAFTAGMAAYYLRLGQLGTLLDNPPTLNLGPDKIKEVMLELAWSRTSQQGPTRNGISNGIEGRNNAPEWSPNVRRAAVLFAREFNA
jgi:hypothetical protein